MDNYTLDARISKKLSYILRYGAEEEGLIIDDHGFVSLGDLMMLPMMGRNKIEQVLSIIMESKSYRGAQRFELEIRDGMPFVRAAYARQIRRCVYHNGTSVVRLYDQIVDYVCANIHDYDLTNFQDTSIILDILRRFRLQGKLNNKVLKAVLSQHLDRLDLNGCLLTPGSLAIIGDQCPELKHLNLRRHHYVITDTALARLLKKLPLLESLNLTDCHHLSNACVSSLIRLKHLRFLNINDIPLIDSSSLVRLIQTAPSLAYLDIFNSAISGQEREDVIKAAQEKGLSLILSDLDDEDLCPQKALSACIPSVGCFW